MSDEQEIALYVQLLAAHVRMLPLREAVSFLKGALAVAGDHPSMRDLRGTLRDLASGDDQLEVIAGGQLKLNLDGQASQATPGQRKDGQ